MDEVDLKLAVQTALIKTYEDMSEIEFGFTSDTEQLEIWRNQYKELSRREKNYREFLGIEEDDKRIKTWKGF